MKISFFTTATEPFKYPIIESIKSIIPLADEIIIIYGREEYESEKQLLELSPIIKIIHTNKWNEKWKYDTMTEHLNIGLDNCSGDICIKFDIDFIFGSNDKEKFIDQIKKTRNRYHVYYLPRINFMNKKYGSIYKKGLYAINATLLRKDNKKFKIKIKNYTNTIIINESYNQYIISDKEMYVYNFDCTFMDKETLKKKYFYWYNAYNLYYGNLELFDLLTSDLNDTTNLMNKIISKKIKKIKTKLDFNEFIKIEKYPDIIQEKINNLDETQYGYNYFGHLRELYDSEIFHMNEKISIIIPLKNRTNILVDYDKIPLKLYKKHNIELSGLPKKNFTIENNKVRITPLLENLKSIEKFSDKYNFEIIIVDFMSDDYDLLTIDNSLNIRIIKVDEYFSRGLGLNKGYENAKGSLIFYCDADMYFHTDELFKESFNIIALNRVFFPICFDLIEPSHQIGYWRESGYGMIFLTKDIIKEINFKWEEYNTLGKEDNDAFSIFESKNIVERKKVDGYYHLWHPPNKEFKNSNYKFNDYSKKKILLNCSNISNCFENFSDYYYTTKLELGINIVYTINPNFSLYSNETLLEYEKKYNCKLEYWGEAHFHS
jgi:glycosyltransferase involved in cell wall biosynthesis